jgi:hypothetical protein
LVDESEELKIEVDSFKESLELIEVLHPNNNGNINNNRDNFINNLLAVYIIVQKKSYLLIIEY